MELEKFLDTLKAKEVPESYSDELKVLWYDANNDWDTAHEIAQEIENKNGAWLHAYLHRKEGDDSNAAYWYRQAGQLLPKCSLESEWNDLVREFLK